MTKDEALQLAFDWFEQHKKPNGTLTADKVIEALRTALTQPEQDLRRKRRLEKVKDAICANLMSVNSNSVESQPIKTQPDPEPVAVWELQGDGWNTIANPDWMETLPVGTKLYTAPPQRKPLSDEEIDRAWNSVDYTVEYMQFRINIARAIEAAYGIKD